MQHPNQSVQDVQAAHRRRLLASWDIAPCSRVLELGCGQGDMTAVLAEAVGANGHVLAVDIAGRDYGAPLTLGQATDSLKVSELGPRIEFRFDFNILDAAVSFEEGAFDAIVMAHSSWYFSNLDELRQTLQKVKPWTKRLCFAEWDLLPISDDQVPHSLAVLIQQELEVLKGRGESNVRSAFSRAVLLELLGDIGWSVTECSFIETQGMQDADWEIAAARLALKSAGSLDVSSDVMALLESQMQAMNKAAVPKGNATLPCYSLVAVPK